MLLLYKQMANALGGDAHTACPGFGREWMGRSVCRGARERAGKWLGLLDGSYCVLLVIVSELRVWV